MKQLLWLVALAALAGCTTEVRLPYAPTVPLAGAAAPVASVAPVIDERNEEPDWLGAVRGGLGYPLRSLRTNGPVKDVVGQAFTDALAARGLLGAPGATRKEIRVTMHRFECNQFFVASAHADFSIAVLDRTTGREVYRDRATRDHDERILFTVNTGVLGSPDQLRELALRTMNEAIDQLLEHGQLDRALLG